MKKKQVKRKLSLKKLFIFIFTCSLIIGLIYLLFQIKITSINVIGNNYYSDNEIIEISMLENNTSFLKANTFKIKKDLLNLDLISEVKIKRKLDFSLEIDILEHKVLYQRKSDGLYVLDNGDEVSRDYIPNVPLLVNYYPNTLEAKALKAFSKLDIETISKISSIEYSKTDADPERFLLYMADGNLVYINLNRMGHLNKYTEILNEVGTKKGILNLDSGNYFEVKEK